MTNDRRFVTPLHDVTARSTNQRAKERDNMRRSTASILAIIGAIVAATPATVMADTFPAINGRLLVGSEEI